MSAVVIPVKRSLQERMKAATKRTGGVSLMPEPKVKKEEEPVPDLQDVIDHPGTRRRILRLTQQIYEWGIAEREAKANKKPLVDELKELLESNGVDAEKFMTDTLRVSYYEVPRSSINMQKLLEKGVSLKTIQACTDVGRTKTLKVSEPGQKGEEDE